MLTTKSVNSAIDPEVDGLRILATRFRGRGVPASRYDAWMLSLGLSERLLKSVQTRKITWAEFARAYRAEMFMDGPIDARGRTIKNHGQKFTLRLIEQLSRNAPVTLLCHCTEEQQHCHRHLLRKIILNSGI
jgi:uncharacterized protein YeaO (DUF488 family)